MDTSLSQLTPGDPELVNAIVQQLKSGGKFDQFRKECLADVDTKPAYQNLQLRVESQVKKYLSQTEWKADLNKNQLRDGVRKHVQESGMLDTGIDTIINQVVSPKIQSFILPCVQESVYAFLNIDPSKFTEDVPLDARVGDEIPKDSHHCNLTSSMGSGPLPPPGHANQMYSYAYPPQHPPPHYPPQHFAPPSSHYPHHPQHPPVMMPPVPMEIPTMGLPIPMEGPPLGPPPSIAPPLPLDAPPVMPPIPPLDMPPMPPAMPMDGNLMGSSVPGPHFGHHPMPPSMSHLPPPVIGHSSTFSESVSAMDSPADDSVSSDYIRERRDFRASDLPDPRPRPPSHADDTHSNDRSDYKNKLDVKKTLEAEDKESRREHRHRQVLRESPESLDKFDSRCAARQLERRRARDLIDSDDEYRVAKYDDVHKGSPEREEHRKSRREGDKYDRHRRTYDEFRRGSDDETRRRPRGGQHEPRAGGSKQYEDRRYDSPDASMDYDTDSPHVPEKTRRRPTFENYPEAHSSQEHRPRHPPSLHDELQRPPRSPLMPIETDVISSEEDDILGAKSTSVSPDAAKEVSRAEGEDARDGYSSPASAGSETVESKVKLLSLHDTSGPLFDAQSLDSISSNSSGLSFSASKSSKDGSSSLNTSQTSLNGGESSAAPKTSAAMMEVQPGAAGPSGDNLLLGASPVSADDDSCASPITPTCEASVNSLAGVRSSSLSPTSIKPPSSIPAGPKTLERPSSASPELARRPSPPSLGAGTLSTPPAVETRRSPVADADPHSQPSVTGIEYPSNGTSPISGSQSCSAQCSADGDLRAVPTLTSNSTVSDHSASVITTAISEANDVLPPRSAVDPLSCIGYSVTDDKSKPVGENRSSSCATATTEVTANKENSADTERVSEASQAVTDDHYAHRPLPTSRKDDDDDEKGGNGGNVGQSTQPNSTLASHSGSTLSDSQLTSHPTQASQPPGTSQQQAMIQYNRSTYQNVPNASWPPNKTASVDDKVRELSEVEIIARTEAVYSGYSSTMKAPGMDSSAASGKPSNALQLIPVQKPAHANVVARPHDIPVFKKPKSSLNVKKEKEKSSSAFKKPSSNPQEMKVGHVPTAFENALLGLPVKTYLENPRKTDLDSKLGSSDNRGSSYSKNHNREKDSHRNDREKSRESKGRSDESRSSSKSIDEKTPSRDRNYHKNDKRDKEGKSEKSSSHHRHETDKSSSEKHRSSSHSNDKRKHSHDKYDRHRSPADRKSWSYDKKRHSDSHRSSKYDKPREHKPEEEPKTTKYRESETSSSVPLKRKEPGNVSPSSTNSIKKMKSLMEGNMDPSETSDLKKSKSSVNKDVPKMNGFSSNKKLRDCSSEDEDRHLPVKKRFARTTLSSLSSEDETKPAKVDVKKVDTSRVEVKCLDKDGNDFQSTEKLHRGERLVNRSAKENGQEDASKRFARKSSKDDSRLPMKKRIMRRASRNSSESDSEHEVSRDSSSKSTKPHHQSLRNSSSSVSSSSSSSSDDDIPLKTVKTMSAKKIVEGVGICDRNKNSIISSTNVPSKLGDEDSDSSDAFYDELMVEASSKNASSKRRSVGSLLSTRRINGKTFKSSAKKSRPSPARNISVTQEGVIITGDRGKKILLSYDEDSPSMSKSLDFFGSGESEVDDFQGFGEDSHGADCKSSPFVVLEEMYNFSGFTDDSVPNNAAKLRKYIAKTGKSKRNYTAEDLTMTVTGDMFGPELPMKVFLDAMVSLGANVTGFHSFLVNSPRRKIVHEPSGGNSSSSDEEVRKTDVPAFVDSENCDGVLSSDGGDSNDDNVTCRESANLDELPSCVKKNSAALPPPSKQVQDTALQNDSVLLTPPDDEQYERSFTPPKGPGGVYVPLSPSTSDASTDASAVVHDSSARD